MADDATLPGEAAARVQPRAGLEDLPAHLQDTYGIRVAGVSELDLGVLRIDRHDGDAWVARVFPTQRTLAQVDGDAAILRRLETIGYPAERCAAADAVSVLHGQPLLVTRWVAGVPREARRDAVRAAGGLTALGVMLARLQRLPADDGVFARPGGSWHHLADGAPREEIGAAQRMLADSAGRVAAAQQPQYDSLVEALAGLDGGDGLPESFVHADFALANAVATADGRLVLVDWAGAGRAPRLWSLAFLLFAVGFGGDLARVDRVVAGYRRHIQPAPEELARLAELIRVRPVIFDAWAFSMGRKPLAEASRAVAAARALANAIGAHARAAFAAG